MSLYDIWYHLIWLKFTFYWQVNYWLKEKKQLNKWKSFQFCSTNILLKFMYFWIDSIIIPIQENFWLNNFSFFAIKYELFQVSKWIVDKKGQDWGR